MSRPPSASDWGSLGTTLAQGEKKENEPLSGGTVTSDTWVVTNGVYVRDTIIALPDGMLYMKGYGKGAWAVFLMGATGGSKPPPGFASLVGSFSFADPL